MPAIGIVDDRKDLRETLSRRINLFLPKNQDWEVVDTAPLVDIGDYSSWIAENGISGLIVDELLSERSEESSLPADYSGHDVVDVVRPLYVSMPIGIITSYADTEALQRRRADVEFILSRTQFEAEARNHVLQFVRAGTKYYQENRYELERLAELSRKIARGVATDEEIRESGGLQLSQSLPFQPLQLRSDWITKMEQAVNELADLEKRIREHLEDKQG